MMDTQEILVPMAPGKVEPSWPFLVILVAGWVLVGLGGFLLWSALA